MRACRIREAIPGAAPSDRKRESRAENAYTWLGLFGPAQLPSAVLGKLSAEVIRIMHLPEISKRVLNDGYEVVAGTPAQFARDMQAEVATWSRVIREKGIKAE